MGKNKSESLYRIISVVSCLFSCVIIDGDGHLSKDKMLELVGYLEKNDTERIKMMFSVAALSKVSDIDDKKRELCKQNSRNCKSWKRNGLRAFIPYDF